MIKLSYFASVFLWVRPFLWYQGQGHLSVKVKYQGHSFQKMAIAGTFMLHKHILLFSIIPNLYKAKKMRAFAEHRMSRNYWRRKYWLPAFSPLKSCFLKALFLLIFFILYQILDWFKLKSFADGKFNMSQRLNFVLGRIENIVRKG